MVTVIVAHERRLVRQALAKILSLQDQISVVADAADGNDAVAKAERLMADVIVVDSVLPGVKQIPGPQNGDKGRPGVVVLSGGQNDELEDLIEAVLDAAGGGLSGKYQSPVSQSALDRLTLREQQVLPLLADGLSNKQIARRLAITERTVKYHISNILRKLGLFSRTEAAIAFLKNSLGETTTP